MADDVRELIEKAICEAETRTEPDRISPNGWRLNRGDAVLAALAEAGLPEAELNEIISGRAVVVPADAVAKIEGIRVALDELIANGFGALHSTLCDLRAALPATTETLPATMKQPVTFDDEPDERVTKVKTEPVDETEDTWATEETLSHKIDDGAGGEWAHSGSSEDCTLPECLPEDGAEGCATYPDCVAPNAADPLHEHVAASEETRDA